MNIKVPYNVVPAFYHPTNVMLVDDNLDFMNSIAGALAFDISIVRYDKPKKALEFINNDLKNQALIKFNHNTFDIKQLRETVNDPNRFQNKCIVLVDYAMPEMNGINFCKEINSRKIYRLMLTGEAEYAIAFDAFNHRIIDQFIRKDANDVIALIIKYVSENEKYAFEAESFQVAALLSEQQKIPFQQYCLFDPTFIAHFNSIIQFKAICEYYLYDTHGSYLLIDKFGNKNYYLVRDDQHIEKTITACEKKNLPPQIIAALKSREKLLLVDNPEEIPSDWQQRLFSIDGHFNGVKKYYYAFSNELPFDEIKYDIYSYDAYLHNE